MNNLKAKHLFTNDYPEQARSKPFVKALIILQAHAQVYYSILANTMVIWTEAIPTGATDGVYVYISPTFFRSLETDSQRAFLLAHEVGHIVLRHPQRGKAFSDRGYFRQIGMDEIPYNHKLFNQAADYVINADIVKHGLEFIPDGLLDSEISRDEVVDDVYMKLVKKRDEETQSKKDENNDTDEEQDQDGEGDDSDDQSAGDGDVRSGDDNQGGGEAEGDDGDPDADGATAQGDQATDPMAGSSSEGFDTHLVPQYDGTQAEQDAAEKSDHEAIADGVDYAIDSLEASRERGEHDQPKPSKSIGKASRRNGGAAPAIDWQAEFSDRLTRIGMEGENNWSRINRRRYVNTGVITPTRKGSFNLMAMTIDISSSVDTRARDAYMAIVADQIDVLRPANGCIVLFTNTEVVEVAEVQTGSELMELEVPMGGLTYMASSVVWQEENGINPDIHMIFTDGEMWEDDFAKCAESGALLILDRHPNFYVRYQIEKSGINYIVASNDPLAA